MSPLAPIRHSNGCEGRHHWGQSAPPRLAKRVTPPSQSNKPETPTLLLTTYCGQKKNKRRVPKGERRQKTNEVTKKMETSQEKKKEKKKPISPTCIRTRHRDVRTTGIQDARQPIVPPGWHRGIGSRVYQPRAGQTVWAHCCQHPQSNRREQTTEDHRRRRVPSTPAMTRHANSLMCRAKCIPLGCQLKNAELHWNQQVSRTVVEALTGKTFKVLWNAEDEPCDAYLVAAGK